MKKKPSKVPKLETASKRTPFSKASISSTASSSKWIRTERPLTLPAYVKEAVHALGEAGHIAYIVGGSIRDFLLGHESKDHDIATSASPDELCELFPRAVTVGKAFGVIKVPVNAPERDAPVLMEIATFREDLEYVNHRHPKGVKFSGPEEDARRRDFTINALFYDPKTSRILDTTGGLQDLRDGIIRAIGNPSERFREDALRLLRAVRFTARLGFVIEHETAKAIHARARLISKVSAERVRDELTLMWCGPRPAEALEALSHFGLLGQVLPELEALKSQPGTPSPWTKTVKALSVMAAQNTHLSPTLAWATLLAETTGAHGDALQGAATARAVATRLKMSREEIDRIGSLIESQPKFRDAFKMRESTLQRFVREPGFEELLALHRVDATITDGNLACYEFCRTRWLEVVELGRKDEGETARLLDGKDLIQLGLRRGPEFSEILRVVEDLALEKRLHSKEEALEYVVRNFCPLKRWPPPLAEVCVIRRRISRPGRWRLPCQWFCGRGRDCRRHCRPLMTKVPPSEPVSAQTRLKDFSWPGPRSIVRSPVLKNVCFKLPAGVALGAAHVGKQDDDVVLGLVLEVQADIKLLALVLEHRGPNLGDAGRFGDGGFPR